MPEYPPPSAGGQLAAKPSALEEPNDLQPLARGSTTPAKPLPLTLPGQEPRPTDIKTAVALEPIPAPQPLAGNLNLPAPNAELPPIKIESPTSTPPAAPTLPAPTPSTDIKIDMPPMPPAPSITLPPAPSTDSKPIPPPEPAPTAPKIEPAPVLPKIEPAPTPPKIELPPAPPKIDLPATPPKIDLPPASPKIEPAPMPKVEPAPMTPKIDLPPTPPKIDLPPASPKIDLPPASPKIEPAPAPTPPAPTLEPPPPLPTKTDPLPMPEIKPAPTPALGAPMPAATIDTRSMSPGADAAPADVRQDSYEEEWYQCQTGDTLDMICQRAFKSTKYAQALRLYNKDRQNSENLRQDNPVLRADRRSAFRRCVLERNYASAIPGLKPATPAPINALPTGSAAMPGSRTGLQTKPRTPTPRTIMSWCATT